MKNWRRIFSLILVLALLLGPMEPILRAEDALEDSIPQAEDNAAQADPVPPSLEEDPVPPEEEPQEDSDPQWDPVPPDEEEEAAVPEAMAFSLEAAESIYPGTEESISRSQEATLQSYLASDGTWHDIYWARGVNPPSMTGADSFHSFTIAKDSGYTFYQAPFASGKGYYDLNKIETNGYCYLGAASNLIYWWIDQNGDYIQRYLQDFESGSGRFTQHPSLHPIPGSSQWQSLTVRPQADQNQSMYISQKLLDAPLVQYVFTNNYLQPNRKDLGFRADMVLDFFLNGYDPLPPKDVNTDNNPGNYDPNPDGGYFYPVFGRDKLTTFQSGGGYDHYKDRLRQYFQQGMGVAFSVKSMSNTHAITIWGAEYDSEGNLVRLYVTDTDDFDSNILAQSNNYAQALNSYDVVKTSDGNLHMDNRDDKSRPGGFILNACYTVDLNRAGWEKAFSDPAPQPEPPVITNTLRSRKYNPGSQPEALRVSAELSAQDQGSWFYMTPQWYEARDGEGNGAKPIPGATGWSYTPSLSEGVGTRYYFCRITAVKYGNTSYSDSSVAAIQVTEEPVVNAGKPIIDSYPYQEHRIRQGDDLTLRVYAHSPDGGTLSYQWLERDFSNLSGFYPVKGANEASFQVPKDKQGEFGYKCRVTNTNLSSEVNGATTAAEETLRYQKVFIGPPKKLQNALTITGVPAAPAYGDSFTPVFTGGSGSGSVSWSVTGGAVLQADGSVLINDVGSFTLKLTKAADADYQQAQAEITRNAKKAKPQVGEVRDPGNLTMDTDLNTLVLAHTGNTPGKVTLAQGVRLQLGTRNYSWVFTPVDGDHYETAKGLVSLTVAPGEKKTVTIKADPVSSSYDGQPHPGYENLKLSPNWTGKLEISYRIRGGEVLQEAPKEAGAYQVTLKIPDTDPDYQGSLTLNFEIQPRLLDTVLLELQAPAAGETPVTRMEGSGFGAEILWDPADSSFAAGKTYQAQITLTPDSNHCFGGNTLVNGEAGSYDEAEGTFHITKSYLVPREDVVEIPAGLIPGLQEGDSLWLDGMPVTVLSQNGSLCIPAPASENTRVLERFTFHEGTDGDPHTSYPTSMEVWLLSSDGSFTALPGLTDLLTYSGMSIRFVGRRGIRMITGMERAAKKNLTEKGTEGWLLQEYGTAVAWKEELAVGAEPVLGREGTRQNHAYRRGEKDAVFGQAGSKLQYTNVLVGFALPQCAKDILLRPYAIFKSQTGETVTVYGGTLNRSIGYVAYQNRDVFKKGSPAYEFVWEMIHAAYGDQYDSQYQG